MEIQMIGTGSAFAKAFFNNNALVYAGDRTLLIDCGTTAPLALHRMGKSLTEIDAILITHIHADHIGGLEEIAYRNKFVHKRTIPLYIADTLVEPLWNHSLKGGLEQDALRALTDYFDVRPLAAGVPAEVLPGLVAELVHTRHIPKKDSYSLLLNDTFFYTADMVFDPALLKRLVDERGVRTIYHDCQLQAPGVVHACLDELLTLPEELQERIRLMHYGDEQPSFIGRTGKMTFVEQMKRCRI